MSNISDVNMQEELLNTFLLEFEEIMTVYRNALIELRKINGDKLFAFKEIFRVYHTLKGDSAYFEEFNEFTNYADQMCELVRPYSRLDDIKEVEINIEETQLIKILSLNYSRLSSAYFALMRGKSLRALRFKIFLRNF